MVGRLVVDQKMEVRFFLPGLKETTMRWEDFSYEEWKKENDKFDHETFDNAHGEAMDQFNMKDMETCLTRLAQIKSPPFKPNVYYCSESNFLHITLSDEPSYDEWLCHGIVLKLAFKTHELTGIKIEGLSRQEGVQGMLKLLLSTKKQENDDSE